jgi:hypothetical protein
MVSVVGFGWIDQVAVRERRERRRVIIARINAGLAADEPSQLSFDRTDWPIAYDFLIRLVHPNALGRDRLTAALLERRGESLLPFRLALSFGMLKAGGRSQEKVTAEWIGRHKSAASLIILAILGHCHDWQAAPRIERAGVLLGDLVRRRVS